MRSSDMIGSSPRFRAVLNDVQMVGPVGCAVLIEGETGAGKEVIAQLLHEANPTRTGRFVAINCAAIPAALLESELFGHERGAFTGAITDKTGRFEAAHRGTLFLDEIGELPLEMQPKLLRVLQEQEFERLGSTRTVQVDVRLVAATNQNLAHMVQEGKFRADLYYRLNVYPINLPPLRERIEDIPLLVWHFVRKCSDRFARHVEHIPDHVMDALQRYGWPGNIRELQNFVERSVILTSGAVLNAPIQELEAAPGVLAPVRTLADAQRSAIVATLRETNGVVGGRSGAAARLGLPRTSLISRMHKLGISSRPGDRPAPSRQSMSAPVEAFANS